MKLGERVQISIGVPDLQEALEFYTRLGFQHIDRQEEPWPLYLSPAAAAVVEHLEALGVSFIHQQAHDEVVQQVIFGAHNLLVSVVNHDPAGMIAPAGEPLTRCGPFGELAVPVSDFPAAASFWQQVGFEQLYQSTDPYRWGILDDGNIVIGLHEVLDMNGEERGRYTFLNPTLTYFAGDMAERIAALQAAGFSFQDDYNDDPGNAILITPGDKRIFLFEGEI